MIPALDLGASSALGSFDPADGTLDVIDTPTVQVQRGATLKNEIGPQMVAAIQQACTGETRKS